MRLIVILLLHIILLPACAPSMLDKKYSKETFKEDVTKLANEGKLEDMEDLLINIYIGKLDKPEEYTYGQIIDLMRKQQAELVRLKKLNVELLPTALAVRLNSLTHSLDSVVVEMALVNTTPYVIAQYNYDVELTAKGKSVSQMNFKGTRPLQPGATLKQYMRYSKENRFEQQMAALFEGLKASDIQVKTTGKELTLTPVDAK